MKNINKRNVFDIFNVFDICFSNFLFISSNDDNFCITSIGTDGTYRGYSPNFGTSSQPSILEPILYDCSMLINCSDLLKCNKESLIVHTLMWDDNGHFILKIGTNGDEKYNGNDTLIVDGRTAVWNDTEKYYEFTDKPFADELIPLTEKCFSIAAP